MRSKTACLLALALATTAGAGTTFAEMPEHQEAAGR